MSWTWVSDFPNDQNIFLPFNPGFGDAALYTGGVGFTSVDVQNGAAEYSRIIWLETSFFTPTEINDITVNYDYTKGGFITGTLNAIGIRITKSDDTDQSDAINFNDAVNGAGQDFTFSPDELDVKQIAIFVRSSVQASAAYSGSLALNTVTITGNESGGSGNNGASANPFDLTGSFQTPAAFIDDQGGGAAGGAGGDAGGNIASISADGLNIYLCSFDTLGFPVLIKILAALNANGSKVFDPGAGGRIGVQCGKFDADTVWIAGQFDGTNTVEKSENAGSSFTVKDDGTIGTIRTFEVGPNNDNTVIVFDGDNSDILETVDDGANWTTINASVTPSVNSISRFDSNTEEIAIVNQGDASNSVNYSVNSGANLEDYQTGVYPNADGTKVVTT